MSTPNQSLTPTQVGAFQVLLLGRDAGTAFAPLAALKPFMPFRDASCGVPCFHLQVQDCLRGLEKAMRAGFLDAHDGVWRFDVQEYEHYEQVREIGSSWQERLGWIWLKQPQIGGQTFGQITVPSTIRLQPTNHSPKPQCSCSNHQVENGDLNWILPGKLVAFSGPAARPTDYVGFRALVPEDYWDYFRRRRVSAVVRLNKKVYERRRFLEGGFRHHELYFPDGSCPPTELLLRFLEIAEQVRERAQRGG